MENIFLYYDSRTDLFGVKKIYLFFIILIRNEKVLINPECDRRDIGRETNASWTILKSAGSTQTNFCYSF